MKNGILLSNFWLKAHDIRKYRALIISSITAISVYAASAAISVNPANSPAEAWRVMLARAASVRRSVLHS